MCESVTDLWLIYIYIYIIRWELSFFNFLFWLIYLCDQIFDFSLQLKILFIYLFVLLFDFFFIKSLWFDFFVSSNLFYLIFLFHRISFILFFCFIKSTLVAHDFHLPKCSFKNFITSIHILKKQNHKKKTVF